MTQKQPANSNTVTPYFTVKDADKAVEFYKYVFDAKEEFRMDGPDGKIMMTEERPEMMMNTGVTKSCTYVYVDDPDAAFKRAQEKGAKTVMEPDNMFYGDRTACFIDPFGQIWTVALHIEDVSDEEMKRRGREMFKRKAA
jgi:PhnB protein